MSPDPESSLEAALRREIRRLSGEFRDVFSPETVDRYARESLDKLAGSRVRPYLPSFVYRFTRERLKGLAEIEGLTMKERPEVLFVCVRNAGRSQMAAGLTYHLSGGQVGAHSAGSDPAERLHRTVLEAMAELGLDLSREFPKPLTDEVVAAADVIVTMGCGDACPLHPGKKYKDWSIADPAGQPLDKVRGICNEIRAHVEQLLAEIRTDFRRRDERFIAKLEGRLD